MTAEEFFEKHKGCKASGELCKIGIITGYTNSPDRIVVGYDDEELMDHDEILHFHADPGAHHGSLCYIKDIKLHCSHESKDTKGRYVSPPKIERTLHTNCRYAGMCIEHDIDPNVPDCGAKAPR